MTAPPSESMGVTLLSGGLDSTTVTAFAKSRVQRLTALTFHYGQTHSKEVECAGEVARLLGVRHELLDISSFGQIAWYSSLTSPERFPLPKSPPSPPPGPTGEDGPRGPASGWAGGGGTTIPISYVPLRNTFFLTVAGAYLESEALYNIEELNMDPAEMQAYIFMAPNAIDYSGYPDCRPEFYDKMRDVLMYGSKLWSQYHVPMQIETPIIHLSKAEIVNLGMDLRAPLEHTWSCYDGGEVPCGRCDSCILRARGFAQAGYEDPLLVRLRAAPS